MNERRISGQTCGSRSIVGRVFGLVFGPSGGRNVGHAAGVLLAGSMAASLATGATTGTATSTANSTATAGVKSAATAATSTKPSTAATPAAASVAWRSGGSDEALAAAFAEARERGQPLLMYWGASWCPPCNQLKATLFREARFVALSQSLVPVMVDGDAPGAQRIGARYQVRGYPTLVLFSPQGQEITRLPGEVEPTQVLRAVQTALAGGRPFDAILADARAGRALSRNEWRMLAFYSWEGAPADGLPEPDRPGLLAELAVAAAASAGDPLRAGSRPAKPAAGAGADADSAARLLWKALALATAQRGLAPDAAVRSRIERLLADPAAVRRHADLVAYSGDDLVKRLAPEAGDQRRTWVTRMDVALAQLQADSTLARADRLIALSTRVELRRLDEPPTVLQPAAMPASLVREVRNTSAQVDRDVRDGYERQAVIPTAAQMLTRVGLWPEAEALLVANLDRVGEAYALMSQLAGQAKTQGRRDEALRWSERAFDQSRGPATRLQWGASYLAMLTDLAADDSDRVERTAARLLQEATADAGALHERSGRSLQRIGRVLALWSTAQASPERHEARRAVMQRLQAPRDALCQAQAAGSRERTACEKLLPVEGRPVGT